MTEYDKKKRGLGTYSGRTTQERTDAALKKAMGTKKPKAVPKKKAAPKKTKSKKSRGGMTSEEIWLQEQLKKARSGK